jgi:hypothetical protein
MNRIEALLNLSQTAVKLCRKPPGLSILTADADKGHFGARIGVAVRYSSEGPFAICLSRSVLADGGLGAESFQLLPDVFPLGPESVLLGSRKPDRLAVTSGRATAVGGCMKSVFWHKPSSNSRS